MGQTSTDTKDDNGAFDSGYLKVGNIHSLYYEQHGKQDGKPVIFLHGGPGARATVLNNLNFFNLDIFRVVLLDQRGAGKSLPRAEIRENTSQLLVQDIESIRTHLSIPKWHTVFGGSWGSTLAILYAQTHPESVSSLVLRGIFLFSDDELDWFFGTGHGMATIFPEAREQLLQYLTDVGENASDPVGSYYRLITHDDQDVVIPAAREWARQEFVTSHLHVDMAEIEKDLEDADFLLSFSKIEVSYFKNKGWLEKDQLLRKENLEKIKHIPTTIVQGRFDSVCPPKFAWLLYQGLGGESGKCELYFTVAGHSATEPETSSKLVEVCEKYGAMDFD